MAGFVIAAFHLSIFPVENGAFFLTERMLHDRCCSDLRARHNTLLASLPQVWFLQGSLPEEVNVRFTGSINSVVQNLPSSQHVQDLHSAFRYFRKNGAFRAFRVITTGCCVFWPFIPLHPGKKDRPRIPFRSGPKFIYFPFMVIFWITEKRRSGLCGFFSWFQAPAATKITSEFHPIALCE